MRHFQAINQVHILSRGEKKKKSMGWDDQVTCIQKIDQVHVQAGDKLEEEDQIG